MRGLAWVLGLLVISVGIGLMLADSPSVSSWTIRLLSLAFFAALAVTVVVKLVLPLRKLPTDTQLAQFVQEKNPGLEDRLVSAVEAIEKPKPEHGLFSFLLIKDALDRTSHVKFGDQINKRKFNTFAALNGGFVVAFLIGLYLATLFLPNALDRLTGSVLRPPSADQIKLTVTPGSVTVPKGSDISVKAVLSGYDADSARIYIRYENSKDWDSVLMDVVPENQPTYQYRLFNLQEQVRYYVESFGRKSDEFTITVADLPRVEKMDYTYDYPAYTGMADKKEENAFDMVALKGTIVEVNITSNQQLSGGELIFSDGNKIPLKPSGDKQVVAKVTVDRNATFKIDLTNTKGETTHGIEEFRMEATDDQKKVAIDYLQNQSPFAEPAKA
jgi:hypothetical protein